MIFARMISLLRPSQFAIKYLLVDLNGILFSKLADMIFQASGDYNAKLGITILGKFGCFVHR